MASKLVIPEVLNHYNVYDENAKKLIGVSGEIELGELEAITDTIEGSGIIGEIEDPVTGQFSSLKIKIPFSVLYEDIFKLMNTTKPPMLVLRSSMQCMDPTTGETGRSPAPAIRPAPARPSRPRRSAWGCADRRHGRSG